MQIRPGIEIIETSFWNRPLNLALFRGDGLALIDSGVVETPAKAILPYLASHGLSPKDLSLVVITHAHTDHLGGNEALRDASAGRVRFAAHRLEVPCLQDPASFTRQSNGRFVDMGMMSQANLEMGITASGNGITVHQVLQGGEVIPLGQGLTLEIHHCPGHSFGNVCVLERSSRVLVQGETVAGIAQYDTEGKLLSVPSYEDVAIYLKSIAYVAGLGFDTLVPSHLPLMGRPQAARFFAESLDFTLRFDQEVKQRLQRGPNPTTIGALWRGMDGLWGVYPADVGLYALLETHVKDLAQRGLVAGSLDGDLTWIGPDRDDLAPLAQAAQAAIRAMGVR